MNLPSIAASGLDRAESAVERAAAAVGRAAGPTAAPSDTIDLSAAAVDLLTARAGFAINARLLKMADQIERRALDIVG